MGAGKKTAHFRINIHLILYSIWCAITYPRHYEIACVGADSYGWLVPSLSTGLCSEEWPWYYLPHRKPRLAHVCKGLLETKDRGSDYRAVDARFGDGSKKACFDIDIAGLIINTLLVLLDLPALIRSGHDHRLFQWQRYGEIKEFRPCNPPPPTPPTSS